MFEQTYTPPPPRTLEDVEKVAAFIKARVEPLRDAAHYKSEEGRAFQALLDMVVTMTGAAKSKAERGDSPEMLFFHLSVAARQWKQHPDFLPGWERG